MKTQKDIEQALRELEKRYKKEKKELVNSLIKFKKFNDKKKKASIVRLNKKKTHHIVTMEQKRKYTGKNITQISGLINKQISAKKKSGGFVDERLIKLQEKLKKFKGNKENLNLKNRIIKDMSKLMAHSKEGKKLFTIDKNGMIRSTVNKRIPINENSAGFMDIKTYLEFVKNEIGALENLNDTLQLFGTIQYQSDFNSMDYGGWIVRVMKSLKVIGTTHEFVKMLKGIL